MASTAPELRLYRLITELIPLIEAKIAQIEAQDTTIVTKRGVPDEPGDLELTNLESLLARLQQIKSWLENDTALKTALSLHLTNDNERNQRREAHREWAIAIITTLVGVILGWLSSIAAPPSTVWHAIFH
jgi:hypothetical protein